MSIARIVVRLLLVAVLVGVCVASYKVWQNRNPDYILAAAQANLKRQQPERAKLRLQTLVQKHPQHAEGRVWLSKALLAESTAKEGRPITYADHNPALSQLMEAARLAPEHQELQQEVVTAWLARQQPVQALEFAERLRKLDRDNLDALYVLAVTAVAYQRDEAAKYLAELRKHRDYRTFQVLQLAAAEQAANTQDEQLQQTLKHAAQTAAALPKATVDKLDRPELVAMTMLLNQAVDRAAEAPMALERAAQFLSAMEKFSPKEVDVYSNATSETSKMLLRLASRFPAAADTPELAAVRKDLLARGEQLNRQAIDAKIAPAVAYRQLALAAFDQGNHQEAELLTAAGIAAAPQETPAVDKLELHLLAARNAIVLRKHAQAQQHIEQLAASKSYAGWGFLYAAHIAAVEGRHEKAYGLFGQAQRELGSIWQVRMGLAQACLALGRWQEALPHLESLEAVLGRQDVEVVAWAAQRDLTRAQLHLAMLRAHLALREWDQAQPHLTSLNDSPLKPLAQGIAAAYEASTGQRQAGAERLASVRQEFPDHLALIQLDAALRARAGDIDGAGKLLEESAAAKPDDLQRQLLLVRWRLARRDSEAALALLTELETRFPDSSVPSLVKAKTYLALGERAKCMEIARRLKEKPEAATAASFLLAAAEMGEQQYESAATELAEAADRLPNYGLLNLLKGELEAVQGDYESAIESLGDTLDVTQIRAAARQRLLQSVLLLAKEEGAEAAEQKIAPLLAAHPQDPFLLVLQADLRLKQGHFEEGMKLLDRAGELGSYRSSIPYIKAVLWLRKGDVTSAYRQCEESLRQMPDDIPLRMLAADIALLQQKYPSAEEHSRKALELRPRLTAMVLARASALAGLKRTGEAISLLRKEIETQPKTVALYLKLAALQYAQENFEEALATLRTGREQTPEHVKLLTDELIVLCKLERTSEAEQAAQAFVQDKPEVARLAAIGKAFLEVEEFALAQEWLSQALVVASQEQKPAIHLLLGNATLGHYQAAEVKQPGDLEAARDHFQAVFDAQPRNLLAANNLAWILAVDLHQPAEGVKVIDQAFAEANIEKLPVTLVETIGVVYRLAGRLDDSQQALRAGLAANPDNALLIYHLALATRKSGDLVEALQLAQRAVQLGVPEPHTTAAAELLESLTAQSTDAVKTDGGP